MLSSNGSHRGVACELQRVLELDKVILASSFGPVGGESDSALHLARGSQVIGSSNVPWAHLRAVARQGTDNEED